MLLYCFSFIYTPLLTAEQQHKSSYFLSLSLMIHLREREHMREREGTGNNEESEGQMGWSLGGQKNPRDSRNSLPGSALGDHEAKVKTSNFCPYPYLCRWATLCPNQGIGDLNAISNTTSLTFFLHCSSREKPSSYILLGFLPPYSLCTNSTGGAHCSLI